MTTQMTGRSAQAYAAAAGMLLLVSFAAGGFGEAYAPAQILVANDANATAANIRSLDSVYRLGLAAYLIEAIADIALALIFYVLLKPVNRSLALLAAFFGILSTALFAVAQAFYFAPAQILKDAAYLTTFSPAQLNTLAFLFIKLYGQTIAMYMVFYGVAWIIRGYLIFVSGYLPRLLGILMAFGGVAFAARSFVFILMPSIPSGQFPLALFPGGLLLMLWLLLRGVNVRKWDDRVSAG